MMTIEEQFAELKDNVRVSNPARIGKRNRPPMPRNEFGLINCDVEGCNHTGQNGFKTPQLYGYHRYSMHGIEGRDYARKQRTLARRREAKKLVKEKETDSIMKDWLTSPSQQGKVESILYGQDSVGEQLALVAKIMQISQVNSLTREQLEKVFNAVLAAKQ